MVLDPEYIKKNVGEIGKKEARVILKEWISESENLNLRKEALNVYISLDEGNNFRFYEQLFLTDEEIEIRNIAGTCLKDHYLLDKKLISLLQFVLFDLNEIEQKLFAIELLNSINIKKTRKFLKEYLKRLIKLVGRDNRDKLKDLSKKIFDRDYNKPFSDKIPSKILDIIVNLTLSMFYENIYGYTITLREGLIVQLNCEGAGLTKISELKGLDRLIHIEHLNLHRNNIDRIEQLNHLKELKSLILSENLIKKIENLEGLEELRELNLTSNKIEEIHECHLKSLNKFSLDRNFISEIKNLDDLGALEFLNLSHNRIVKISGLYSLVNLKSLNLSFNNVTEISGLETLERLEILHLNNNDIHKLTGLEKLLELRVLTLSNNKIEKIENLENLVNLKKLEISENKITMISGLENQLNLQELFLDRNKLKKVEGLDKLEKLIILFLEKNEIETFNIEDIGNLKNLNFFYLNGNPLNSESRVLYLKKTRFP